MRVRHASAARPQGSNEDFVFSSPSAVVVLDGAGMAPGMESGCRHGVAWYVEQLGTRLHAEAAQEGTSLTDCLAQAIEATADVHRDTCAVDDPLSPSATVAVARVRGDLFEWLALGDCTVVTEKGGVVTAITDDRLARVAPRAREALVEAAPGSEERRRAHQALVTEERGRRNTPSGYWVAAADPAAAHQALTGMENAASIQRAALLTDGAARLVTTFHETDWRGFLDLLTRSGPDHAIREVREAEQSDPDLSRWPRSKQHDDATIAYIHL
ncbi:protein phosphatase 2C domain-containing protein [Streptomyces sp. NPDC056632]|uniref:protein phosphatase 2C domain-containing protein n=1 Tax=Streptomyces sp. NPDC056632 TaxID=3345884 RepID=UPI0036A72613